VDYETQQRILKDSAKYFAGVVDGMPWTPERRPAASDRIAATRRIG
jgi:hypothetical protein